METSNSHLEDEKNELKLSVKSKLRPDSFIFVVISELAQLVIIVVLIAIAVLTFGNRIPVLNQWGVNFFAVISGSMEPTIPAGALLLAGKFEPVDLRAGDIITYQKAGEDSTKPTIVTHRIFAVKVIERLQDLPDEASD